MQPQQPQQPSTNVNAGKNSNPMPNTSESSTQSQRATETDYVDNQQSQRSANVGTVKPTPPTGAQPSQNVNVEASAKNNQASPRKMDEINPQAPSEYENEDDNMNNPDSWPQTTSRQTREDTRGPSAKDQSNY